ERAAEQPGAGREGPPRRVRPPGERQHGPGEQQRDAAGAEGRRPGGRLDGEPVDPQYRAVAVELERPFGERPLDGPLQRVEPARLSHDQDRTSSLTGRSSAVSGVRGGKPAESPGRGKAAPLVQAEVRCCMRWLWRCQPSWERPSPSGKNVRGARGGPTCWPGMPGGPDTVPATASATGAGAPVQRGSVVRSARPGVSWTNSDAIVWSAASAPTRVGRCRRGGGSS